VCTILRRTIHSLTTKSPKNPLPTCDYLWIILKNIVVVTETSIATAFLCEL
jgi:hypothetical protein